MKNKNIFKNFIYIFFAICLFASGGILINQNHQVASAENTQSEKIDNKDIPPYFLAEDYLLTEGEESNTLSENRNGLISYDTFLYYQESNTSSLLKFSLLQGNGNDSDGIYNLCYYPDPNDQSVFHFYKINVLSFSINNENQNINMGDYVTTNGQSFPNYSLAQPESLEINFSKNKTEGNNISILDDSGNVVEGLYTISLSLTLYTCTGGRTDMAEDTTSFSDMNVKFQYSFYVISRENYITNNAPNTNYANFDHVVPIKSAQNPTFSSYLFSNYSGKGSAYQTPYIEYDISRFDVRVSKDLSDVSQYCEFKYDTDTNDIVQSEKKLVEYSVKDGKCRIYFLDVGDYTIEFSPIKLIEINSTLTKYNLDGVASITKKLKTFMYGYQAYYTDMDKELDENNMRQSTELKLFDNENEKFIDGADITSGFLNSNKNYAQNSNEKSNIGSSTFLIGNIVNYITNNKITPVKTNQTPVNFVVNANPKQTTGSYIFSTTKISSAYEETNLSLNGKTLYRTNFTGRAENSTGTYIYIVPYTFDNFFVNESLNRSDLVFFQVFFFEITKELPSIAVKSAESNQTVHSNTFVNEDVVIETNDTTKQPHNKDVTVVIYAKDFSGNYLDGFGGESGKLISLSDLNSETLTASAHYTIRLYFSNEISTTGTSLTTSTGFREQFFTIDKTQIEGITGVNVTEITNSTNFKVGRTLETFTTNQNFAVSWTNKASGATTEAYYRYFPLVQAQYYGKNSSNVISTMLNRAGNTFLPVNYVLDMDTEDNSWQKYYGNPNISLGKISAEYVLSDSGLYVFDIYDEAGNHSVQTFLIDTTTPVFALHDTVNGGYTLTSSSMYVSTASTLHWAKNKAIYIANWSTPSFTSSLTSLNYEFYKDHNGKESEDIYNSIKSLYNTYLQFISCNENVTGADSKITKYSNYYITIPIDTVSYYMENSYIKQENVFSQEISIEDERTYRILIRDLSNTKFVENYESDKTSVLHFKNYYSARQTIIVSFDDSKFEILYEDENVADENDKYVPFTSNITSIETIEGLTEKHKTTYFAPTNLSQSFTLSFIPTIDDGEKKIQVKEVTIKYYPYVTKTEKIKIKDEEKDDQGNVISEAVYSDYYYSYMELSDTSTTTIVYTYEKETDAQKAAMQDTIKVNSQGFTTAGKYEITRTYLKNDTFSFNEKDYYQRTLVLYVDRNDVITNADRITDETGNTHTESLVGGDIFISMYDNKADLVVTFPNSPEANSNGASLYNNGTVKSILTTNMLPVYVYVPQVKYTKYVQKVLEADENYHFDVTAHEKMNNYTETELIGEYYLYSEIYRVGADSKLALEDIIKNQNLIAKSSSATPTSSNNGFLTFYKNNGEKLEYLSEQGLYYVKVSQGMFGLEGSFDQSIIFCFEIQASKPDFVAQDTNGSTLNFDETPQTYYTNQPKINLLWDEGSTYMAEIDQGATVFKTSNGKEFRLSDDILDEAISSSNGKYVAKINLEKLGIYSNDGYVDITMQYKNHQDQFYTKVTKRIYVDLSAPANNINSLVEKAISGGIITSLTEKSLRTYYTAQLASTNDPERTSYNVSATTDFPYYSYNVTSNYIDTLKKSIGSDIYKIYTRAFLNANNECTKYKAGEPQETSPTSFLASNFVEINDKGFEGFKNNTYYEIIETDLAGNMTIYTIYVVNYESCNLISYTDAEGTTYSYTADNWEETNAFDGATHNIYSKTGFGLNDINYFGDAWAQIKLESIVGNVKSTKYLMMSPWKKGYVIPYANNKAGTEIAIPDLIDGLTSSRYKSSLSIYNSEKGEFEQFFINIRNTELSASLTNTQNREYIRFAMPSNSALQDKNYASTFVTSLKITADGNEYYKQTNNLGYASLWQGNDKIVVTNDTNTGTITFEINPNQNLSANTRIVYEYTDNYGSSYKEIHLYKESIITQEISSNNDLYAYYEASGKLFYITKDGFKYTYNPNKYTIKAYDYENGEKSDNLTKAKISTENGVSTFNTTQTQPYNDSFVIEIYDKEDVTNLVKSIYFTLYNQLPTANYPSEEETDENNKEGEFKFLDVNKTNITKNFFDKTNDNGYYSEVTILFSEAETFIPVKYSISQDKQDWQEISSGTRLRSLSKDKETWYLKIWYDEAYLKNEAGNTSFVFQNVPSSQIFTFNLSSVISTFWVEKTINGVSEIISKSGSVYTDLNGLQYANHYIINLDYSDSESIKIHTNTEQGINAEKIDEKIQSQYSNDVYSDIWQISNASKDFNTKIVITYIPSSDNFVDEFYTYNQATGIIDKTENLINLSSTSVIVGEESSINRIELQWTKYYGIPQNEIKIEIVKDGVEISPTVYTRKDNSKTYSYIYLSHSGKYTIKLYDSAGNVQKFNRGNAGQTELFNLIFLKDVPFTVTYTDVETGQEVTSLPIKQAVYNGSVTLNIDKTTRSDFYASNGYPKLTVKKNGNSLSEAQISELTSDTSSKISYSFTESGYYEICFTEAKSNKPDVGNIRQESYQFTILNANEYRYAYVYNKYSSYYVEKVVKDGKDVTQSLINILDVSTIKVNQKTYLAELPLSYLDEKTGAGTYLITINSNDTTLKSSNLATSWTYKVTIQVGSAPIKISIPEGKSTTGDVTITFNSANIYQEMGECFLKVVKYTDAGTRTIISRSINENSSGEASETLSSSEVGTYYVQIVSPSGNLLFSYKILKKEPMNPASIIAIVISSIVLVAVVFLVIKLRKRISVK